MDNFYIPWDMSYMSTLFDYLSRNIGNAMIVGIIGFAVVYAVFVIVRIVKGFF